MSKSWLSEWLLLGLYLFVALLLGLLAGAWGWWLALAFVLFFSRHLFQLYRLERWLRLGSRRHPPESWGVWGEVFDHYYRLQRRYYKRKKRLGRVIREFRESTEAMPDGTLVLDGEWRMLWFNHAARQLLGLVSKRDLGQPVTNLIRSPQFRQYLNRRDFEQPLQISLPTDDSRKLSLALIPYGSNQYLLLFRDVTRMHRLQAMRRDFVANASHELRSPLTVLNGYLEAMIDDPEIPPVWGEPLSEMRAQSQRMNSLVTDLLELSRLETEESGAPREEAIAVPAMIKRIINAAQSENRQGHQFGCECVNDLDLLGSEREVYSALSNLVINAVRYTPEQGRIDVRWFDRADGCAVFEVHDTGIGIEPRHIPLITQRFFRVDSSHSRSVGGTGLGLAIVKHVLQRHDGFLEVESQPGEGSVFRCVFPRKRVVRQLQSTG
ncbi:MAG: phosphate regulon sensor histidine kinase PhoR [Wenzhouxiangella sp.]